MNEEKELNLALQTLENQEVLLYPTDTVWGLGCDATNSQVVDRIFRIKNRVDSKNLIVLVSSLEMLKKYVTHIPENVQDFIAQTSKPTTIIYKHPKGIAENVISNNDTVAIRIVQNEFCSSLINAFGKPIVSTSANISGEPTPNSFGQISEAILNAVDFAVHLFRSKVNKKASSIVQIEDDGQITILRE